MNEERTCRNCKRLRWGWYYITDDECDYTCDFSGSRVFLLCVHGKSEEQIEKEFKEHARICKHYEERDNMHVLV